MTAPRRRLRLGTLLAALPLAGGCAMVNVFQERGDDALDDGDPATALANYRAARTIGEGWTDTDALDEAMARASEALLTPGFTRARALVRKGAGRPALELLVPLLGGSALEGDAARLEIGAGDLELLEEALRETLVGSEGPPDTVVEALQVADRVVVVRKSLRTQVPEERLADFLAALVRVAEPLVSAGWPLLVERAAVAPPLLVVEEADYLATALPGHTATEKRRGEIRSLLAPRLPAPLADEAGRLGLVAAREWYRGRVTGESSAAAADIRGLRWTLDAASGPCSDRIGPALASHVSRGAESYESVTVSLHLSRCESNERNRARKETLRWTETVIDRIPSKERYVDTVPREVCEDVRVLLHDQCTTDQYTGRTTCSPVYGESRRCHTEVDMVERVRDVVLEVPREVPHSFERTIFGKEVSWRLEGKATVAWAGGTSEVSFADAYENSDEWWSDVHGSDPEDRFDLAGVEAEAVRRFGESIREKEGEIQRSRGRRETQAAEEAAARGDALGALDHHVRAAVLDGPLPEGATRAVAARLDLPPERLTRATGLRSDLSQEPFPAPPLTWPPIPEEGLAALGGPPETFGERIESLLHPTIPEPDPALVAMYEEMAPVGDFGLGGDGPNDPRVELAAEVGSSPLDADHVVAFGLVGVDAGGYVGLTYGASLDALRPGTRGHLLDLWAGIPSEFTRYVEFSLRWQTYRLTPLPGELDTPSTRTHHLDLGLEGSTGGRVGLYGGAAWNLAATFGSESDRRYHHLKLGAYLALGPYVLLRGGVVAFEGTGEQEWEVRWESRASVRF